MALTFRSAMVAKKLDVMKDWTDAVHPGITIVPSGVLALNGALARGCVYVFAG
jgi:hypothetical protein